MKSNTAAFLIWSGLLALAAPALAQTLTVKSSDTLADLNQRWAETYGARHPALKVQTANGSTAVALADLAQRKVQAVIIPRGIRFKEAGECQAALGQRPVEYRLGINALAIYVHPENPVKVLTYDELDGIYRGKYRNWKEVGGTDGPIVLYGQATNTPAGELFAEEVLNGKTPAAEVRLLTASDLLKALAKDKQGIGFAAFTQAEGTRALGIKRAFSSTVVDPGEEAISNRIYPITRFIFAYVDPAENKGELKAYMEWMRGDEGQEVLKKAGYHPLAAKWRQAP